MGIKIKKTCKTADWEKAESNIIYNRFDLFCKEEEFEAVKIQNNGSTKIVEYRIEKDQAELGLWLVPMSAAELEQLIFYITRNHPQVKKVIYKNGLLPYGKAKMHNHFRIVFPETVEEMESRVSPKSWSKMRRRNRRAEEAYGKMSILEYSKGDIPEEIVEAFFQFKLATRNRVYKMTAKEYLERYHVSDCYVVKFGDTIGAMHFCCEQCPIVYGENHSYNPALKEYSLGKFIFAYSLVRMVEKKHTEIYLAGGDYEYKTHYGSIEETLYDCEITVADMDFTDLIAEHTPIGRVKVFLREHLSEEMVERLRKLRDALKAKFRK